MQTDFNLNDFVDRYPQLEQCLMELKNERWKRVKCTWNEIKKNIDDASPTELKHTFTPALDVKTGDMYLDCSVKLIYAKFLIHTFYRPIHVCFKTLYHLAIPISITHAVMSTIFDMKNKAKENEGEEITWTDIFKKCVINSVHSLCDIVRTPFYGIALEIVSLAANIIGLFVPSYLLDLRKIEGKLILALYRDDRSNDRSNIFCPCLEFICFTPIKNLQSIEIFCKKYYSKQYEDTRYELSNDKFKHVTDGITIVLANYARKEIMFRRGILTLYTLHQCSTLSPDVAFESDSRNEEKVHTHAQG